MNNNDLKTNEIHEEADKYNNITMEDKTMTNETKNYYFFVEEVSPYGVKNGMVDYYALLQALDADFANDIYEKTQGLIGYWELINGYLEYGDDIFTYYRIPKKSADYLMCHSSEVVLYNSALGIYLLGMTTYGTAYTYVLSSIPLNDDMAA